jgi:hypothetical protein
LDPDGNNIEAVFHGPTERSATSVIVQPKALGSFALKVNEKLTKD